MRPNGELPSDHYADRRRQTPELRRKAHLAVHRPSACSGVKALRNTSDARLQAARLCCRFGPLTPSARSANLIAGDGTKNGLPAPNKELTANPKQPLDRKSPIQVRCEPDLRLPSRQGPSLPIKYLLVGERTCRQRQEQ